MAISKRLLIQCSAALGFFALYSCNAGPDKAPASETETATEMPAAEEENEWLVLFDGTSTEGWRGFNTDELPSHWGIEGGALKTEGGGGGEGQDIVYGARPFEYFELALEWKISKGGNSGIFYHVQEGEKYKYPYETAPEYQLIDGPGYEGELEDWQKVGADYAMYPADPEKTKAKPAGEWNSSRILFTKEKAEYWLNGEKVVEFVPWSDDWMERRNSGKWKDFPDYGKAQKGLIALQDHGSFVWFRNIKIKEL